MYSGDIVRILLNYDEKRVTFHKGDTELFAVQDIPTGDGKSYRMFVDGDKKGDVYTIITSKSETSTISMDDVTSALEQVNISKQDAKEKIKKLDMDELGKLKQQTSAFLNECKEFEQNFENTKKEVELLNEAIDKEMKPDVNDYKVQWVLLYYLYLSVCCFKMCGLFLREC